MMKKVDKKNNRYKYEVGYSYFFRHKRNINDSLE